MADKYTALLNFKWGLDSRRSELTTQPGALAQCQNGFINAGGDIEQRKSFVKDATAFPTKVFGIQDTDTGLMVFGDVAPGTVGQTSPLPTGVVYQQLNQSPIGINSAMDGVLFSCNFLGKAFVITHYGDNSVAMWYNGTPVWSSVNGIVIAGYTSVANQSAQLADIIIRLANGWSAVANTNESGAAQNGSTIVKTPVGIHIAVATSENSANGALGALLIDQNTADNSAKAAIAASAAFTLNAGSSGTVDVSAPKNSDGSGTVDLTGGAISFNTTLTQTATDIKTAINNNTYITGYSAASSGATVTVFAPTSWGNVVFNLSVTTTGTITTVVGTPSAGTFALTLNPNGLSVTDRSSTGRVVSGLVKAGTVNASATPTFNWTEIGTSGITMTVAGTNNTATAVSATFSKFLSVGQEIQGTFQCVATSSGATPTTSTIVFTVTLILLGTNKQQP